MSIDSMVRVPLLDLRLQYASIRRDIQAAIERVCDSQQFILGPEVEQFERELAAAIGVRFAVGVSSGTDALLIALMALGVQPGDEVITPTFSFFATAGSVARLGARPVFVDVDADTLMMTADSVRAAITPRTRAIIPVHLYGLCADMGALTAVASEAGVPIVEDAAQAIGATYRGRQAGTFGLLGCFSFFPSKNLGAFGDAGLVTTDDDRLAARVRRLRNHGAEPKYYHHEIGGNFRLDALQAAILRVKLPHLTRWNEQRRARAATYRDLFERSGLLDRVRIPVEPPDRRHVFHQYVIRVGDRDGLKSHLAARGIGTDIYYPVPFHRQACFAGLTPPDRVFPNADAASAEVLALPVFPELTEEQQTHVVNSIAGRFE
ncbi:MAG TPA: DegT/DnrJ/EryC1/StrS family aminotransferase [Vicinamibacterales bacterium]|nr:DegT/DnrJ/EryC1/StrS family aminotransferase [Vicinamibacterales bacterium]